MKIAEARIENFKRLKSVVLIPGTDLFVIGGRNGQGKTSVLDALAWAITGQKPKLDMPVREGEERADIEITTDTGIVIRQYITAKDTYKLEIKDPSSGMTANSPADYLAKLTSKLTFDVLDFTRQKPGEQGETLRKLLGLDWVGLDGRRKELFDARTGINREIRDLVGVVDRDREAMEAVPDDSKDAGSLADEMNAAIEHNNSLTQAQFRVRQHDEEIARCEAQLEELRQRLAALKRNRAEADATATELGEPIDVDELREAMRTVQQHNEAVTMKRVWREKERALETRREQAENLTAEMASIDTHKREMLKSVEMPIDGLDFDEDGLVTYHGIPFTQCASSEQIRVSAAIGLRLAGKMRVLFIRDGSLLDDNALDELEAMANVHDAQIIIERVGADQHTSVVIEDGEIARGWRAGQAIPQDERPLTQEEIDDLPFD